MDSSSNVSTEPNTDLFPAFVQEMKEILSKMELLLQETEPVGETIEYQSCVKIRGQSILPPLMTPERKLECLQLKRQALEVEARLAERRRHQYAQFLQSTEGATAVLSGDTVATPLKKNYNKLRAGSVESVKSSVDPASQYDSLSSQLTVVDAAFKGLPDDSEISSDEAFTPPAEIRARKGSYTLTHPSPELLAYVKQSGKKMRDLQFPRPRSVLTRPRSDDHSNQEHIQIYLEELSRMPDISADLKNSEQSSTREKVMKSGQSDSFRSDSQKSNNQQFLRKSEEKTMGPRVDVLNEKRTNLITGNPQALSPEKMFKHVDSGLGSISLTSQPHSPKAGRDQRLSKESDEDSPDTENPQSIITQRTTPGPPSLMNDLLTPEPSQLQSVKENPTNFLNLSDDLSTVPSITLSQPPTANLSSNVFDASRETSLLQSVSLSINEVSTETINPSQKLHNAISSLALRQQSAIEELLNQQAQEREKLERLFAAQQRELVQAIMVQINQTKSPKELSETTAKSEFKTTSVPSLPTPGRSSPLIPTLASKARPSEDQLKQLPPNFLVPEVAYTPEMKCHFDKLSALVKGHLTRRLLHTERVQRVINSMRDTMTIALQLHREARNQLQGQAIVSMQDIELHRRLLQQIFKDSQLVHSIFFEISTAQRIAIIRQDRELREERLRKGEEISPRTQLSAVTRARMQQRKQIQALLIKTEESYNNSSKQRKKHSKSYDKPWKIKQIHEVSPYAPKGGHTSSLPVRRSLNLNDNENRSMTRSLTLNNKTRKISRMTRSFSPGAPLTVIHNKPWK